MMLPHYTLEMLVNYNLYAFGSKYMIENTLNDDALIIFCIKTSKVHGTFNIRCRKHQIISKSNVILLVTSEAAYSRQILHLVFRSAPFFRISL